MAANTRSKRTFSQRLADRIAEVGGSWTFILILLFVLILWMVLNTTMVVVGTWDPYPFILLNLFLSCLAAFQAPVILMSQNRAAERDRKKAERDHAVNRKAEREIEDMQRDFEIIKTLIKENNEAIKELNSKK